MSLASADTVAKQFVVVDEASDDRTAVRRSDDEVIVTAETLADLAVGAAGGAGVDERVVAGGLPEGEGTEDGQAAALSSVRNFQGDADDGNKRGNPLPTVEETTAVTSLLAGPTAGEVVVTTSLPQAVGAKDSAGASVGSEKSAYTETRAGGVIREASAGTEKATRLGDLVEENTHGASVGAEGTGLPGTCVGGNVSACPADAADVEGYFAVPADLGTSGGAPPSGVPSLPPLVGAPPGALEGLSLRMQTLEESMVHLSQVHPTVSAYLNAGQGNPSGAAAEHVVFRTGARYAYEMLVRRGLTSPETVASDPIACSLLWLFYS